MVSDLSGVQQLVESCKKLLPSINLQSGQGGEYTASLPPDPAVFASLLENLSQRKQELQLRHIGVSLTSLERVFLRYAVHMVLF